MRLALGNIDYYHYYLKPYILTNNHYFILNQGNYTNQPIYLSYLS